MGKFNLNTLLSSSSINATDKQNTTLNKIKIIPISVHDLIPSKNNFYSVEEIVDLKNSIEMFGLKQNLTVKPLDNGKYRVIAGHRRCLASRALVEEGKTEYEMIPCAIETDINDIKEELLLITTNATSRQLSDWEKTQQAKRMKELLEQYKKQEKIPGRIRELIAKVLEISPSQVGRMDSISKHLTTEFKEEFRQDNINISTAYELSTLPKEEQKEVLRNYKDVGNLSIKDVKNKKAEIKEQKDIPKKQDRGTKKIEPKCNDNQYRESILQKQKQNIPIQIYPTIYETLSDMNKEELAQFICFRCDGTGFCEHFMECGEVREQERYKICMKWLNMQVQKG